MNNIKRMKAIFISFILLLFLTGCWSSREIDTLGVYVGLALDVGKNQN